MALTAENDIVIEGSHIAGTHGVLVDAGGNLAIVEGRNTTSSSSEIDRRTRGVSGLSGLVTGVPLTPVLPFSRTSEMGSEFQSDTASASTIRSSEGGVLLHSDGVLGLRGVEIAARRDITIEGADVDIRAAVDSTSASSNASTAGRGLTAGQFVWHDPGTGINARNAVDATTEDTALVRTTLNGANVHIDADSTLAIRGTAVNTATDGRLTLTADVLVLGAQVTDHTVEESREGRDLAYQRTGDQGLQDQTTHYNLFNTSTLAITANRVETELGASASVEALAQLPGMAWVAQLQNDPDLNGRVDWTRIEEAHRTWNYSQQGLTQEGAAIVTLVVSYFSFGAGQALGAAAGGAAGGTAGTVIGGAVTAGFTALVSQAAIAFINNQGDLEGVFHDLGSSSNVRRLLTAMLTGGVLAGLNLNPTGMPTVAGGAQPFMTQLGQNLAAGAARALIGTAINGGSLEDALREAVETALLDTAAAQSANWIGRSTQLGSFANYAAHAIAGCAVGTSRSGVDAVNGCAAGAVGAMLGEAAAIFYNSERSPEDVLLNGIRPGTAEFASLVAGLGVAIAGGEAAEINLGSSAGANAALNNFRSAVVTAAVEACIASVRCMLLLGISATAVADLPRRTEELMRENSGLTHRAAETLALSEVLTSALLNLPTTGSGSAEPLRTPDPTILPALDRVAEEFGPPPLEYPQAMQAWLGNVLEGVPLDQAESWAREFISSLPAAQQQSLADLIMVCVHQNFVSGKARERQVTGELQAQYPGASVQIEQYLRDSNGKIAIDPDTGTGRRLDHVVIENGRVIDVVETTSLNARKDKQLQHEANTRRAGGVYVRDRETGMLVEVPRESRVVKNDL